MTRPLGEPGLTVRVACSYFFPVLKIPLDMLGTEPKDLRLTGEAQDYPELKDLGCQGQFTAQARVVPTMTTTLIELEAEGRMKVECARCTEGMDQPLDLKARLLVEKRDQPGLEWVEDEDQAVEEYLVRIGPDVVEIPLEHLLAEQILLNYSLNPPPPVDAANRCRLCGRDAYRPEAGKPKSDPRWDKLRGLQDKGEP